MRRFVTTKDNHWRDNRNYIHVPGDEVDEAELIANAKADAALIEALTGNGTLEPIGDSTWMPEPTAEQLVAPIEEATTEPTPDAGAGDIVSTADLNAPVKKGKGK